MLKQDFHVDGDLNSTQLGRTLLFLNLNLNVATGAILVQRCTQILAQPRMFSKFQTSNRTHVFLEVF